MKKIIVFIFFCTMLIAETIKPIMVYDSDILDDASWNAMIHKGIIRFEKKFSIDVKEVSIVEVKGFNEKIKAIAKAGYDPIILTDINEDKEEAIKEAMLAYPKKRYIILNGSFNIPNADFLLFSQQEATFLAGYLAAKKSQTKTIGFVGGMEIPAIKNFLCGYMKGATYADPKIKVLYEYLGDDFTAWKNPKKGYEVTLKQIEQGADIIFGPAGGSSLGILKAAHEKGKLGIGVDSNQNHLYPGSVLTSVMMRVDNAVYIALATAHRGIWRNQVKVMGLQEKGVALAFDEHNAPLISKALKEDLEHIKSDIILHKIELTNYIQTKRCIINGELLF